MSFYVYLIFASKSFIHKLPDKETLNKIAYKTILIAFPLMLLIIVTGAIWAHYSWGSYWGWDPKESWSLITWIIYALYFLTRITKGWQGKRTALIAIKGFAFIVFTYLWENLELTGEGLHLYGVQESFIKIT